MRSTHRSRWPRLACAIVIALPLSGARAQSYSKLMTNGHGLALTRLAVQERMQGNWVSSPSLRQGVEYRLVFRFTNYFPSSYDIIKLSFEAHLGGAMFYPSDNYYGSGTKWLNGYDKDGLGPTESKTYYQHFKWFGPPMATPLVSFKVVFAGGEVHTLPNLSGQIRPS